MTEHCGGKITWCNRKQEAATPYSDFRTNHFTRTTFQGHTHHDLKSSYQSYLLDRITESGITLFSILNLCLRKCYMSWEAKSCSNYSIRCQMIVTKSVIILYYTVKSGNINECVFEIVQIRSREKGGEHGTSFR